MPGPETRVEIEAVKDAQEMVRERVSETRQDMRDLRGDVRALDARMDCDEKALVELRGEVRLLTAAVDALTDQQRVLLADSKALREALESIRVEVVKAGEQGAGPIGALMMSGRAKAGAAGGGVLGVVSVVYAFGKLRGWWE